MKGRRPCGNAYKIYVWISACEGSRRFVRKTRRRGTGRYRRKFLDLTFGLGVHNDGGLAVLMQDIVATDSSGEVQR